LRKNLKKNGLTGGDRINLGSKKDADERCKGRRMTTNLQVKEDIPYRKCREC